MATIVLDPGHGGTKIVGGSSPNNAKGPAGTLEKTLTLRVAFAARQALEAVGIDVVLTRSSDVNVGLVARADFARQIKAPAFVSIHFNGFNNSTQGTETWVAPNANRASRAFAGIMQPLLQAATGLKDRGIKNEKSLAVIRPDNHAPNTAAILIEISFMDVPREEQRLLDAAYITKIGNAVAQACKAYLNSIDATELAFEFAEEEFEDGYHILHSANAQIGDADVSDAATAEAAASSHTPPYGSVASELASLRAELRDCFAKLDRILVAASGQPGLEIAEQDAYADRYEELAPAYSFKTTGLTKTRFLADNSDEIHRLITDVNATLDGQYGLASRPISVLDFAVMLNCEAGITSKGIVDPDFEHSEGERGLLPLPDNLNYWNGELGPVPNPNVPMPLATNVWHFTLYLGQLKNKVVRQASGRAIFRDLFRHQGIAGSDKREARLLAGIVHGYFTSSNYGGTAVPFSQILDGYARDVPLPKLMKPTRYRHAGKPLMVNRHTNIEEIISQMGDDLN